MLIGGPGNDFLDGGPGNDTIIGGGGSDIIQNNVVLPPIVESGLFA